MRTDLRSRGKACALRVVELSEKRDIENRREGSIGNRGRLRRGLRFPLFELLRQFCQVRAIRNDCLGTFASFNQPHGQSHDESRFTCFRFDLDLTAVPVSHDTLANREAETFSRTDDLCGEEGLEDTRAILRRNAGAVVDDLHDRLVVFASRLNGDFAVSVYRIRRVIEQIYPDLRKLARIAAHVPAVGGKIPTDAHTLELVIQNRKGAPDLLMHVDIRGFCALLLRAGTYCIDQIGDPPGALLGVIEQCLDRHPQSDPSHRVPESVLWQIFTQQNEHAGVQSRADKHRSDFPGVRHATSSQPGREGILRIALLDRLMMPASRKIFQNLARERDQPVPVLMRKRVMQSMGDRLDRLNDLSQMHGDALGGGGRIIQFMRQPGGHGSEGLQLFPLSR